ncbi:CmcJ/NvfI family oxidoreductase [Ramlibacter sp. AN1015]|uniref:CmcJ/NvfI family oxidoreductase n=1 Tax=Ramlibacter sp. AN1015 TaxID=3133428 RepID=UPI0030C36E2D
MNLSPSLCRAACCHPSAVDVAAALSFLAPGQQRPFSYAFAPPEGVPWESGRFEEPVVAIADARGLSSPTSLDAEGFELWDAPSAVRDFDDAEEVTGSYYAEASELALAATGGTRAFVFDHLLRRRAPASPTLSFGRATGPRAGVNGRIHCDYTETSGRRRLELVLPDARARAGIPRFSIVNVWRPLRHPVLDVPLAFCDARTVQPQDLVAAEVRYARRTGEIYFLVRAQRHRWCYFSAVTPGEALVFKQFDSDPSVARFTPHGAFDHPAAPVGHPPRESIELRCLVVYDF